MVIQQEMKMICVPNLAIFYGIITKEEYAYTLREHQKVIDEVIKSAQRTESRRLYATLEYKMWMGDAEDI